MCYNRRTPILFTEKTLTEENSNLIEDNNDDVLYIKQYAGRAVERAKSQLDPEYLAKQQITVDRLESVLLAIYKADSKNFHLNKAEKRFRRYYKLTDAQIAELYAYYHDLKKEFPGRGGYSQRWEMTDAKAVEMYQAANLELNFEPKKVASEPTPEPDSEGKDDEDSEEPPPY